MQENVSPMLLTKLIKLNSLNYLVCREQPRPHWRPPTGASGCLDSEIMEDDNHMNQPSLSPSEKGENVTVCVCFWQVSEDDEEETGERQLQLSVKVGEGEEISPASPVTSRRTQPRKRLSVTVTTQFTEDKSRVDFWSEFVRPETRLTAESRS